MPIPEAVNLGKYFGATIHALFAQAEDGEASADPDLRRVMGFVLPAWQRPLVWDEGQMVRFVESAWLGLPIGTYTVVRPQGGISHPMQGMLIDGQQRISAIGAYLDDAFPVFGTLWSETSATEKRRFKMVKFGCYEADFETEIEAARYYDLMNFGGTAHEEGQRAMAMFEDLGEPSGP